MCLKKNFETIVRNAKVAFDEIEMLNSCSIEKDFKKEKKNEATAKKR